MKIRFFILLAISAVNALQAATGEEPHDFMHPSRPVSPGREALAEMEVEKDLTREDDFSLYMCHHFNCVVFKCKRDRDDGRWRANRIHCKVHKEYSEWSPHETWPNTAIRHLTSYIIVDGRRISLSPALWPIRVEQYPVDLLEERLGLKRGQLFQKPEASSSGSLSL